MGEEKSMTVAEISVPDAIVFPEAVNRKVRVTPEIATEYLTRGDLNRKLSRDRAVALADAFRRGEYRLTGDAIVFNKYGRMTNGQHRMLAVVISGLSLEFWVMEGAENDEQMVQDTGRPRSYTDHLRMTGVGNANVISGLVKLWWNYEAGIVSDAKRWHARTSATVFQLDAFYRRNEASVKNSVRKADSIRRTVPINGSVLAISWIMLSAIDQEDAEGFWREISLKSETSSSGARALVSQFMRVRKPRAPKTARRETNWYVTYDARHQLALVFKAWNAYRDGKEVQALVFRAGGASPEAFPVPH
jgi:hypothetical protein